MKFIHVLTAFIAAFVLISCNEKVDTNVNINDSGRTTFTLDIGRPPSESTRATAAQEDEIKTVHAYLFVSDGKTMAGMLIPTTTQAVINGSSASVTITIDNDNFFIDNPGDNRAEFYLVANADIVPLPEDRTAKAAFLNATVSGFDNNATGDDFSGLVATKYVGTWNFSVGENTDLTTMPPVLDRVQSRVFVSNTQVLGDDANGLDGYRISFSGLADRAVLTNNKTENFTGVLYNGTYDYTVKGDNDEADFYNQEPVGYFYPVPSSKRVTVTVSNPSGTATGQATFSPSYGKNYRIKVTPSTDAGTVLGVEIEIWKGEETRDRYMVVVVAGQSNAVGYDESVIDLDGLQKVNPNAFQLAYRDTYGGNLEIVPLKHRADDLQDMSNITNVGGGKGTKGIHLPLANELLRRIPKGYKIMVIPVAFGGTAFSSGSDVSYDTPGMKPDLRIGRWGTGTAYARTMIDRTIHALNMNPDNKFLGVVWCQGEHDRGNPKQHYIKFADMAEKFFAAINVNHADRCPKGVADKDLWYNYSSTRYWCNWYNGNNASATFGGYKVWNPNTFVHVPQNTDTNAQGGNGNTSSARESHFGNNAYAKVIAPMVAQCMDDNGGLFNGKPNINNVRFVEKNIRENAASLGGSMDDSDIKTGMQFFFTFRTYYHNIVTASPFTSSANNPLSIANSTDLIDINGVARTRPVLSLPASQGGYVRILQNQGSAVITGAWSVAFLVKRTGDLKANNQPIIHGTKSNSPYFGYKAYGDEAVGENIEFVAERIPTSGNRNLATPAQFIDADNVRAQDQWVHYVITFNGISKTRVYANGQLVSESVLSGFAAADFTELYIGRSDQYPNTIGAMLADVGLWNKELTEATVKKLYLYSYYGYTK